MGARDPHEGGGTADAAEFGWRVHGALDAWIGKVDTKASIALAIEIAVFGFILTFSDPGEPFAGLSGTSLWWYRVGVGSLLASTFLSLAVVFPQLNRRRARTQWRTNMIYFGHLRRWDAPALARALPRARSPADQLAIQLVAMANIAWRKHVWLQGSLLALAVGAICLLLVGTWGSATRGGGAPLHATGAHRVQQQRTP